MSDIFGGLIFHFIHAIFYIGGNQCKQTYQIGAEEEKDAELA